MSEPGPDAQARIERLETEIVSAVAAGRHAQVMGRLAEVLARLDTIEAVLDRIAARDPGPP